MPMPHILAHHGIRLGSWLTLGQTLGLAGPEARSLISAAARAPALAAHSCSGPEGYWALPG
jgi:hypothetical protein